MGFFPQFPGFGGARNQSVTVRKGADLNGLLGGTELDDGQAQSLALLQAMPALQQAGLQRTASPVGSIAQNLIPIFGALVYAKAAQQQAQAQAQQQALKDELVQSEIDLNRAKMNGAPEGAKNLQQLLAQRLQNGQPIDDIVGAIKATRAPTKETEWEARLKMAGGDEARAIQQKNQDMINRAVATGRAEAQANQAASLDLLRQFGGGAPGSPVSQEGPTQGMTQYGPPDVTISPKGEVGFKLTKPKASPETAVIVARTQALADMKPKVDQVLANTPDIPNISFEATRYMMPAALAHNPGLWNAGQAAIMGQPNPKYSQYFQTMGELNYGLTALATRLASRSGSARMAEMLSPHIPQLGLQPSENKKKVESLYGPHSVLVSEFVPEGRKAVRSGDLSVDEFSSMLKGFGVIQNIMQEPGGRPVGVTSEGDLIPLN